MHRYPMIRISVIRLVQITAICSGLATCTMPCLSGLVHGNVSIYSIKLLSGQSVCLHSDTFTGSPRHKNMFWEYTFGKGECAVWKDNLFWWPQWWQATSGCLCVFTKYSTCRVVPYMSVYLEKALCVYKVCVSSSHVPPHRLAELLANVNRPIRGWRISKHPLLHIPSIEGIDQGSEKTIAFIKTTKSMDL